MTRRELLINTGAALVSAPFIITLSKSRASVPVLPPNILPTLSGSVTGHYNSFVAGQWSTPQLCGAAASAITQTTNAFSAAQPGIVDQINAISAQQAPVPYNQSQVLSLLAQQGVSVPAGLLQTYNQLNPADRAAWAAPGSWLSMAQQMNTSYLNPYGGWLVTHHPEARVRPPGGLSRVRPQTGPHGNGGPCSTPFNQAALDLVQRGAAQFMITGTALLVGAAIIAAATGVGGVVTFILLVGAGYVIIGSALNAWTIGVAIAEIQYGNVVCP